MCSHSSYKINGVQVFQAVWFFVGFWFACLEFGWQIYLHTMVVICLD